MLEVRRARRTADSFDSWMDRWLASPWPESADPRPARLAGAWRARLLCLGTHDRLGRSALGTPVPRREHRLSPCRHRPPNLAARLARDLLSDDETVGLLAEMGMVGYEPQAGDPYIFANVTSPTPLS